MLWCHLGRDELGEARAAGEEAVSLLRELGGGFGLAHGLSGLGLANAGLGDRAAAVRNFQEGKQEAVRIGAKALEAIASRNLAAVWMGEGRTAAAVSEFQRCLAVFRAAEITLAQALTLRLLAVAYDRLGDSVLAEESRREAGELSDPGERIGAASLRILTALATA